MRESLFSSLKIVAMMLAVDGNLDPKEKSWFISVTKSYGASSEELQILEEFLHNREDASIESLTENINEDFDKRKLLEFLQMAMRQDGLVKNSEIKFFREIQRHLSSEASINREYRELGREMIKRDKDIELWNDLNKLATMTSANYGYGLAGHHVNQNDVFEFISFAMRHRLKTLVVLIIISVAIYLKYVA